MSDDEDLREEVQRLREEVDALQRRLDGLESRVDTGSTDRPSEPPDPGDTIPPPDASTADAEPVSTRASQSDTPDAERAAPDVEIPTADAERGGADGESTAGSGGRDWELAVGVRWLGVAGALALVVGVVFFVRLAIERGLLGPLGRVAVGTAGGLLLFGVGRYAAARQGYVRWGRIAAGAGLAVAYFSIYAAYGFYGDALGTPLWAVLGAMTLLVGGTVALSVADRAPLVAGEAFLLGYVTAYLSTDAATLVVTPVYALLLAGGVVAIATVRPWRRLVASSVLATHTVVWLWILQVEPPEPAALAVGAVAFVVYLGGSYVLRGDDPGDRLRDRLPLVALSGWNAGLSALVLEISLGNWLPEAPVDGIATVAVALALAAFYGLTDRSSARPDETAAGGSVVLLAVGLGLAGGTFAATVAALAVVCLGVAIARVEDAPAFRVGGHLVAAGVVVKLLAVDATELPAFDAAEPLSALTGRPAAFALGVAVLYALSWWFTVEESSLLDAERSSRLSVNAPYAAAATGVALVAFGLELSGLGTSVAWALFGFALLGVGLYADIAGVRLLGVGVLGLATAKVFLYDTSDLDAVARTLAFLVLGGVLLAASYVYARTRDDIEVEFPGRN